MAGLDLSGIQRFIETSIVVDEVRVVRPGDKVLGDDGLLTQSATLVGDTLGAIIRATGNGYEDTLSPEVQRIVAESDAVARLMLRIDDPIDVAIGDQVAVTTSNTPVVDPDLVGYEYVIVHVGEPTTFSPSRVVFVKPAPTNLIDKVVAP